MDIVFARSQELRVTEARKVREPAEGEKDARQPGIAVRTLHDHDGSAASQADSCDRPECNVKCARAGCGR